MIICAFVASPIPASVKADSYTERREQAGVRLFKATLSADTELVRKANGNGRLDVAFFYYGDENNAAKLKTAWLESGGRRLKNLEVDVRIVSDPTFRGFEKPPAGIYLADRVPEDILAQLIAYGIKHHVLIYSPYEGHVEKGVHSGLSVEAQVRPYVNLSTLKASEIRLKSFFLRVAKVLK